MEHPSTSVHGSADSVVRHYCLLGEPGFSILCLLSVFERDVEWTGEGALIGNGHSAFFLWCVQEQTMLSVTSEDDVMHYNRDGAGREATQRLLQSDEDLQRVLAGGAIPYPLQGIEPPKKSPSPQGR